MAIKHAVVRTDLMAGTKNGAFIKSAMVYDKFGEGAKTVDIDNAQIVILGKMEGREIYMATAPAADSVVDDLYLVAVPELFYDESVKHYLPEWVNVAGKAVRVYKIMIGDRFSATAEAFEGTPAVGKYVGFAASSTKLQVLSAKDDKTFGEIKHVETVGWGDGAYTYYMIDVIAPGAAS